MLLVLGSALAINRRGAENDWPYGQADAMRQALTNGLTLFAARGDLRECAAELDRFSRLYEDGLKIRMGPFDGCRVCRTPCFYRPEVIRLVSPIEIHGARKILASPDHIRLIDKYSAIKKELIEKVQAWLGGEGSDIEDLAYCVALHIAPAIYPDEYDQSDFATNIAGQLFS